MTPDALRALAAPLEIGDIPGRTCELLHEAADQWDAERATATELNRRATVAEAALLRRLEDVGDATLGRALSGAAWRAMRADRDRLREALSKEEDLMMSRREGRELNANMQVLFAAFAWWQTRRPLRLNQAEHLSEPLVNCVTGAEKELAGAVARALTIVATDSGPEGIASAMATNHWAEDALAAERARGRAEEMQAAERARGRAEEMQRCVEIVRSFRKSALSAASRELLVRAIKGDGQ